MTAANGAGLPAFLQRHTRSVIVIALALALAGLAASVTLPVGLFPQVAFPRVVASLEFAFGP